MKVYIKENIVKPANKIIVVSDDRQYFNPSEDMILKDGWVEYNKEDILNQNESASINKLIEDKIQQVTYNDGGYNVFYLNDIGVWFDKATRAGLMLKFQAEKSSGQEFTELWYDDQMFTINIDEAIWIFQKVELYAYQCFAATQNHIKNIKSLKEIDALNTYNYREGYPQTLHFSI